MKKVLDRTSASCHSAHMPTLSPPRSSIYRTAELAVGGDLKKYLAGARRKGKTFADISCDLRDLKVLVTYEGVRGWCNRLSIPA